MPIEKKHVEMIVDTVQFVCRHYIKHFSYEGFTEMFDKITVGGFSGSFRLIHTY